MTPLSRLLLVFIGVLLAGVPLVCLTATSANTHASPQEQADSPHQSNLHKIYLCLRYTGNIQSGILRYEDHVIAEIDAGTTSPYDTYIELPVQASTVDIEAELFWEKDSPENAVTLTLEPQGKPAQSDTQWTGSDGSSLHTIYSFRW